MLTILDREIFIMLKHSMSLHRSSLFSLKNQIQLVQYESSTNFGVRSLLFSFSLSHTVLSTMSALVVFSSSDASDWCEF